MRRQLPQYIAVIVILAAIVFGTSRYTAEEQPNDHLRFWVLNVGQGDALLIDTPAHQQILIDGGPDSSVLSELSRVLPLTDKEIDLVISTHDDADHLAGLNEVLRHYKVDKIWTTGAIHTTDTYRHFLELIKQNNITVETVKAGTKVQFGDLQGIAIWPLEGHVGELPDAQNTIGIVTFWQYGNESLVLTADIEKAQEEALVSKGIIRPATILKIAHHGSKTSSSEAFLKAVSPKITVISVSAHNKYGHPAPTTLDRLKLLNIPVLRTDQDGTIRFDIWLDHFTYKTHS